MPFAGDRLVASPSVTGAAWVAAFDAARAPLVLDPPTASGWFGGEALVACDPVVTRVDAPPTRAYEAGAGTRAAGESLDRAFRSLSPTLCAALLPYDGGAVIGTFPRGLVRRPEGWRLWGDWRGEAPPDPVPPAALGEAEPLVAGVDPGAGGPRYRAAVERAREAMRAGDVYVLNLCRMLRGSPAAPPAVVYATLLRRSLASMAAAWMLPDRAVLSASPERFLRVEGRLVTVHPVKGTRPRHPDPAEDAAAVAELRASEKERAEHVMVVDLERNDIGRVCLPGSVLVGPLAALETTPYCHQLVSRVGGLLRPGTTTAELLGATFPCGSVTGAPKDAAMRHVARLEDGSRGEYTGSLVVAVPGRIDSSVLIRTAVVSGGRLAYGVGCGITVDSDPRAEWDETLTKAVPLTGRLPGD